LTITSFTNIFLALLKIISAIKLHHIDLRLVNIHGLHCGLIDFGHLFQKATKEPMGITKGNRFK